MLAAGLVIALGVVASPPKTAAADRATALDPGGELYVVCTNSVSVVDLATSQVVRTVKLYHPPGQVPFAVATGIVIDAGGQRGLISTVFAGVETVDLRQGKVVAVDRGVVNDYGISPGAQGLAAFVLESSGPEGMPAVVPISATGKPLRSVPLVNETYNVAAIATAPDGEDVYALLFQGLLVPINIRALTAGARFRVPSTTANGVAISPDNHFAYVAVGTTPGVVKVNLVTGATSRVSRFGTDPYHIVVTPDGHRAYVSDADRVFPLNLMSGKVSSPISLGPAPAPRRELPGGPLVLSMDGKILYAADPNNGTVVPLQLSTGHTGPALSVGCRATALAVGP